MKAVLPDKPNTDAEPFTVPNFYIGPGARAGRPFRGDTFDVTRRREAPGNAVRRITVDGRAAAGARRSHPAGRRDRRRPADKSVAGSAPGHDKPVRIWTG